MESTLKSKYITVHDAYGHLCFRAYDEKVYDGHMLLEDATLEIRSDHIDISGILIKYTKVYKRSVGKKTAIARGYDFDEEDIDVYEWKEKVPEKGWRGWLGKKTVVKHSKEYLKPKIYEFKKKTDYRKISNSRWTVEFSKGEILSDSDII